MLMVRSGAKGGLKGRVQPTVIFNVSLLRFSIVSLRITRDACIYVAINKYFPVVVIPYNSSHRLTHVFQWSDKRAQADVI